MKYTIIHYENTPIQIYGKFHPPKLKLFRYKNANIFYISAQNIDYGYSLEPPRRGGSNEYSQSMFCAEMWKISEFFIWKFSVFGDKIFYIFE